MISVTILALDYVLASSVMGTLDVLCQTGATWNYIVGTEELSYFDVKIVTRDGKPVKSRNQAAIDPNGSMYDVDRTDVIIVSSFSDHRTLETSSEAIEWLKTHHQNGTTIAGICAGVYILAEAGLLDDKTATTHWGFADDFQRRYPKVRLKPDKIITDEGSVLCSGGCSSYIDLSMYLVERYCGRKTALESSKAMLHDLGRYTQEPYQTYRFKTDHPDSTIRTIQDWLANNYSRPIQMKAVAANFGLSRRVFERRFKAAAGCTPLTYLQHLRMEAAKAVLETSLDTVSDVALRVGYEDTSFFRKLFKKHTGLVPKAYQMKFRRGKHHPEE